MSTRRNRSRTKTAQRRPQVTISGPSAATTPEDARADAVRRLIEPGKQRLHLVAELETVDTALRPLVVEAVRAGVPYRRIAELTSISRATVARWGSGSADSA